LARHAGAYKSEKRKKELSRLKKQEEKRQRRMGKKDSLRQEDEAHDAEATVTEGQEVHS
jgi:hypothetical protein